MHTNREFRIFSKIFINGSIMQPQVADRSLGKEETLFVKNKKK